MHAIMVMNIKITGTITLLLLLLLFSADNIHARLHIEVRNELGNGRWLTVHCQSGDDDLGYHVLPAGDALRWSFNVNFFASTLFYCDVKWYGSHWYHFNAYDADRDYMRCKSSCKWMISQEGKLYGYDQDVGFWRYSPFNPTSIITT